MADFNIRSDSVNVEQIMEQIRARIREKRGVDYTEQQIRELASVKLETFLNPHQVTSGLLAQFRDGGVSAFENYEFEDGTLFETHRAPLRWLRRALRPFLKLFFNLDRLIAVMHLQSRINTKQAHFGQVSFELLHNLVVETTRLGIEVRNLKMRVESLSSRFDFAERRARALEGIVESRLEGGRGDEPAPRVRGQQPAPARGGQGQAPGRGGQQGPAQPPQAPAGPAAPASGADAAPVPSAAGRDGEPTGDARRRRRRRRGRRGGPARPGEDGAATAEATAVDGAGPEPAEEPRADRDRPSETGRQPAVPREVPGDQGAAPASLPFPNREEQ
jgi:hypothetical protein